MSVKIKIQLFATLLAVAASLATAAEAMRNCEPQSCMTDRSIRICLTSISVSSVGAAGVIQEVAASASFSVENLDRTEVKVALVPEAMQLEIGAFPIIHQPAAPWAFVGIKPARGDRDYSEIQGGNGQRSAGTVNFRERLGPKQLEVLSRGTTGKLRARLYVRDNSGQHTISFPDIELHVQNNVTP